MLAWQGSGGFSVDVSVRIEAEDRAGVERLVRYCAELLLTPLELLEALAKFVPPPRVHRHRYHGVLAPNARLRPHVVALGRPELVSETPAAQGDAASPSLPSEPAPAPASPARIRWAVLLARIYDVLPLLCTCGGEMRILAFLTDPPVVSAILRHLEPGPPRNARCVG